MPVRPTTYPTYFFWLILGVYPNWLTKLLGRLYVYLSRVEHSPTSFSTSSRLFSLFKIVFSSSTSDSELDNSKMIIE